MPWGLTHLSVLVEAKFIQHSQGHLLKLAAAVARGSKVVAVGVARARKVFGLVLFTHRTLAGAGSWPQPRKGCCSHCSPTAAKHTEAALLVTLNCSVAACGMDMHPCADRCGSLRACGMCVHTEVAYRQANTCKQQQKRLRDTPSPSNVVFCVCMCVWGTLQVEHCRWLRGMVTPSPVSCVWHIAGGFQLARDKAPYKTPDITDTVNVWKPPCLNCRCLTATKTKRLHAAFASYVRHGLTSLL